LAAQVANEWGTPESGLHIPSLFYLALILLVMELLVSLLAKAIAGRFDVQRTFAR
jgi:ABC-type phosphate transport system permease subunit